MVGWRYTYDQLTSEYFETDSMGIPLSQPLNKKYL